MSSRCLSVLAFLCAGVAANAKTLRVCAEPNNLPFSNQAGEDFENRIAELVATSLHASLAYTWTLERKSPVKDSLEAGKCDALFGAPALLEDTLTTAPYYRSSYVFLSRVDRNLALKSLLDEQLAQLRIGIPIVGNDYAPPAAALAHRGISQNIVGFPLVPARDIVDAVDSGTVDVAIMWGPVAGYFAKCARHSLAMEPVAPAAFLGVPFTFDIAIAVRRNDDVLRAELDRALADKASAIQKLLADYGIPQVR